MDGRRPVRRAVRGRPHERGPPTQIPQAAFIDAPRFSGGDSAGQLRNEDLEALAYDTNADVLYAFSGSTPSSAGNSEPTVYRLVRGGGGQFQVESWRALPSESPGGGLGARPMVSPMSRTDRPSAPTTTRRTRSGPSSRSRDSPGSSASTSTTRPVTCWPSTTPNASGGRRCPRGPSTGWGGISLTGLGFLDTRGVEVIGERLFITDGGDLRSASDPMNHAVFVLDVAPDNIDPTITMATPPAGAVYARNRVVNANFSCADRVGGSGVATCVGTVGDGQAINTATWARRRSRLRRATTQGTPPRSPVTTGWPTPHRRPDPPGHGRPGRQQRLHHHRRQ